MAAGRAGSPRRRSRPASPFRSLARYGKYGGAWAGVIYRSASVRYANRDDLLTGTGSKSPGASWNPPGSMVTVYMSLDIQTAVAEARAHHRYYGFGVERAFRNSPEKLPPVGQPGDWGSRQGRTPHAPPVSGQRGVLWHTPPAGQPGLFWWQVAVEQFPPATSAGSSCIYVPLAQHSPWCRQ
jgi:RES domain